MPLFKSVKINSKNISIFFIATLIIVACGFVFSPIKKIAIEIIPPKPARVFASKKISLQTPFSDNLEIKQPIFPENVCDITNYGAVSGGKVKNTQAFVAAIDDCYKKDGGTILVPNGTWLTGPIHLKSNLNLHLEDNATILFSTDLADYLPAVFSRFEGIECYHYSALIYATDAENIAVTGNGTLNGQGAIWQKVITPQTMINLYTLGDDNVPAQKRIFDTPTTGLSPSFINFINSKTIFIDSIHIINSPEWVIQPVYSTDITISNVKINTINGANTDGIVIDSSKNVLVENSSLATGDDAIVLKSGRDKDGQRVNRSTTNVVVRNNNIQEAHAAMAIGSEMSGGINNIWFFNNTINRAQYAIRIKSQLGRGGIVENIWAQNITARRIDFDAINIETSYGIPFSPSSTDEPTIRNIKIENITASRAKRAIFINGLKNTPIANIDLNNLKIQSSQKTVIENAVDIRIDHANII